MSQIRILQVGIGPVGQRITRYILQRQGFRIVVSQEFIRLAEALSTAKKR